MLHTERTPLSPRLNPPADATLLFSECADVSPRLKKQESNRDVSEQKRYAANVSVVANVLLLVVKLCVSAVSGSMSMIASTLDSVLDLVGQMIIFFAMRGNLNVDETKYPLGRGRLEPVGLLVVAALMGIASMQIVLESGIRLESGVRDPKNVPKPDLSNWSVVGVLGTIVLKFLLYLLCSKTAKGSGAVQALAQDHKNDVMSNSVALAAAWTASRHASLWWVDPAGAILMSIFIVYNWYEMAKEQTDKLVGRAADPEFINRVKTLSDLHDDRISVDIVRAYHFGERFVVEVEIVMPETTTLKVAHDVSLALQQRIERLNEVERAHVHVDYDFRFEREHKATFLEGHFESDLEDDNADDAAGRIGAPQVPQMLKESHA